MGNQLDPDGRPTGEDLPPPSERGPERVVELVVEPGWLPVGPTDVLVVHVPLVDVAGRDVAADPLPGWAGTQLVDQLAVGALGGLGLELGRVAGEGTPTQEAGRGIQPVLSGVEVGRQLGGPPAAAAGGGVGPEPLEQVAEGASLAPGGVHRACLPAGRPSRCRAYRAVVDEDTPRRGRRGLILAGIVVVIGLPLMLTIWVSEHNADRQASAMADDLRRAGRQVDDVRSLADDELPDVLGHGDELRGAIFGTTGISVAYETSWGLSRRCVHLLLRDDTPVRTEITDSASCRPLGIE